MMAQTTFNQRVQGIQQRNANQFASMLPTTRRTTSAFWALALGVVSSFAAPVLAKFAPELVAMLPNVGPDWSPEAMLAAAVSLFVIVCLSMTQFKHLFAVTLGIGVTLGMMHDALPDPYTILNSDPEDLRQTYVTPVTDYLSKLALG